MFPTRSEVVHCFLDIVFHPPSVWRGFGHLDHAPEGLLNSKSRRCGARLDEPIPIWANLFQVKSVGDFGDSQSAVRVLFVGEKNQRAAPQLLAPQRVLQLPVRLSQTLPVRAVHDEHNSCCVMVETLPVLAHFPLTTDIPHGQCDVPPVLSPLEHFHVEADRRHGADTRVVLQLVEEGRFSGVVQAQKEDLGLWLFRSSQSHGDVSRRTVNSSGIGTPSTYSARLRQRLLSIFPGV